MRLAPDHGHAARGAGLSPGLAGRGGEGEHVRDGVEVRGRCPRARHCDGGTRGCLARGSLDETGVESGVALFTV